MSILLKEKKRKTEKSNLPINLKINLHVRFLEEMERYLLGKRERGELKQERECE